MTLHGKQFIAGRLSSEGTATFTATNPSLSEALDPAIHDATLNEVNRAMEAAEAVFNTYRRKSPEEIAAFIEAIADEIEALGDALLDRTHAETGLPMGRLQYERGRTVNQARLFAKVVREGSWVNARIDKGEPSRTPSPKPDVRQILIPIGPVVVFGASNFPLAISVAGSDTISALGAGCPVVVKAHPAHPGACEMVAQAIVAAAKKTGMPAGVFSMVHGVSHEVGMALVKHPHTKAVAFTGSLRGGRALFDAAAARPDPIPVYAEMGSTNPVFVLPGALKERSTAIAKGFVHSVGLGVGQFCTNPGLVIGLQNGGLPDFVTAVGTAAAETTPATMVHPGIRSAYKAGIDRIAATEGVTQIGTSAQQAEAIRTEAATTIFATDVATFEANPHLAEEVFGPSSVIVQGETREDLERIASNLEGHLTATIHGTDEDLAAYSNLITILENKVGRLIFNGFPTGIEVCAAMHHSGPYPATTDAHYTSIGTASIYRFARPMCYQNFPDAALPEALRNTNTRNLWRLVDNEMTRDDV